MNRIPVKSETISAVGYDPATREMEVQFNDGSVHLYSKVPPKVHAEFVGAKRLGYYFFKKVRDRYSSRELK